MSSIERFNIRVYGIFINDESEVLLSTEWIKDRIYTKFPGGGLEYGEGTIAGLKREFSEEMDCDIDIIDHLYTTDHFVQSAFDKKDQLVSIYYRVKLANVKSIPLTTPTSERFIKKEQRHAFHFQPIKALSQTDLSFPVDRHILPLIKSI